MLINCVAEKTISHNRSAKFSPRSVEFSPDGTKIVSGSGDGTIKVWDSSALLPLKIAPLNLGQTYACWIVCQLNWSC